MSDDKKEIDPVTGVETTGHEWDGIKELNKPLPRWWIVVFYATVVWAIGYMVFMPSIPGLPGADGAAWSGLRHHSERKNVAADLAALRESRAPLFEKLRGMPLGEVETSEELLNFAMAAGRSAFGDNCATCHGSGAQGARGYPNLNDDVWLWGGRIGDIRQTILYGIRSGHPQARQSQMPAFGRDAILKPAEIAQVTQFVLSLSGRAEDPAAAELGRAVFAAQCAICHGADGKGDRGQGAPNLADEDWLYGGEPATVAATIARGPSGVMPAWAGRLDEATIDALAVYVHTLGGGEDG